MYTVEEAWKYRLAQRVYGLRLLLNDGDGASQHELARRLGVSQSLLARAEAGEGCRTDVVVKLSAFFGVSTDFLLGRAKVPYAYHELVDQAYERIMRLASSLDFIEEEGLDIKIRALLDYRDMLRRVARDFVDLAYQFRYPNQDMPNVRVPYGYQFAERLEKAIGEELL